MHLLTHCLSAKELHHMQYTQARGVASRASRGLERLSILSVATSLALSFHDCLVVVTL